MSRDCCVTLPRGAMGLSAVLIVVFPDHTQLGVVMRNAHFLLLNNLRALNYGHIRKFVTLYIIFWTIYL